ncbi:MAG: ABC transporter permease [Deltaproteobacteria bacterium]|nr:ABC transporter permease [Deltaproteobacteria bacterium]
MDLGRTAAVFRKELLHIRRDPRSLILVILLPIMLLIIYGYALTFDIKHVPTAVYDQDQGHLSRIFLEEFKGSRYFQVRPPSSGYGELDRLLTGREVRLALVFPPGFSRDLKAGRTASLQALVDGAEPNTANIVLGYTQALTNAYNQRFTQERLARLGYPHLELPLATEVRFWFNEDLESINFIVPGLIVVIMTMVGTLLTALTVVREVERGTMESLMTTTVRKSELIIGKMGPYFFIGLLDLGLAMAMGHWLFGVPLRGSALLLVGLSAIFLIVVLGQGLLVSVTSHNQLQAFQMAMLITFLPAVLLSGAFFAIRLMPLPLQLISYLVPARYLVTISKGIYLKGIGLEILWAEALVLLAFAAALLTAAMTKSIRRIR